MFAFVDAILQLTYAVFLHRYLEPTIVIITRFAPKKLESSTTYICEHTPYKLIEYEYSVKVCAHLKAFYSNQPTECFTSCYAPVDP